MKPFAIAAGAVAALGLAAAAETASAAPYGGQLIKADYACGPGWHINPWGRCTPNYYGGVYYGWPGYGGYGHGWYGHGWYGHGGWGRGGWGHGGWGHGGGWGGHGGWRR